MPKPKIIIIVGPTASGKSDLAVTIACKIGGEIISADSRQIYKDLDIGSGKITKNEMCGIKHHGLGVAEPMQPYTAAKWLEYANFQIVDILKNNKTPIVVGGTGLYVDALLYGIEDKPAPNYKLRKELQKLRLFELQNIIINKCIEVNSDYYANLNNSEKNNKERLIRKIETLDFEIAKSKSTSNLEKRKLNSKYVFEFVVVERNKEELLDRIKKRLDGRLSVKDLQVNNIQSSPLILEVINLINKYKANNGDQNKILSWLNKLGLEYKYVTLYITGVINYNDMREAIIKESVKYAKRQTTWNKKYKNFTVYK
jgi:tRNA dimethylallyltransferase